MRLPGGPGLWLGVALFVLMRLLPAPGGLSGAGWAVAALAVLMAVLWVSEAIPLAATATLPFLLVPLMGAGKAGEVAAAYWSPILFLVLGGAMVARAVEKSGLHARVALGIARATRGTERGLLLAFMAATAVTSMLVSNTATALIMMPVALALVAALEPALGEARGGRLARALVLGVAWAASIGGLGTLVGSPTNALAADIMNRTLGTDIDFLSWLRFGLPVVATAIPLAALLLAATQRLSGAAIDGAAVAAAVGTPGPMSVAERRLLGPLALLLVGWVLWPLLAPVLGLPRIEDGATAIAVALILFVIPDGRGGALLEREDLPKLPWPVLLLFGGGLALAEVITGSGLAGWSGTRLEAVSGWHPLLLAMLLVALIILVTEFASNIATASGFMPVVAAVAATSGAPALALAMPAALASTWGFMMPAGTPPNAIALASGRVRVAEMVKAGALLDLAGIPLLVGIAFLLA